MNIDTQNVIKGGLLSIAIVCAVTLTASAHQKKWQATPDQKEILRAIIVNQKVIASNRRYYELFMEAKQGNEKLVDRLQKSGAKVDWETMKLKELHSMSTDKEAPLSPRNAPTVNSNALRSMLIDAQDDTLGYDLDKLSRAVKWKETKNCTLGIGKSKHSCHGILGRTFKNEHESDLAFKELWLRDYKEFPNLRLASSYVCGWNSPTGAKCSGGNPNSWLASVKSIYSSL